MLKKIKFGCIATLLFSAIMFPSVAFASSKNSSSDVIKKNTVSSFFQMFTSVKKNNYDMAYYYEKDWDKKFKKIQYQDNSYEIWKKWFRY